MSMLIFFFNDTATTEIYTLSLHDALPICIGALLASPEGRTLLNASCAEIVAVAEATGAPLHKDAVEDRKSTRLNSSHLVISYAVFCLKKKTNISSAAPRRSSPGSPRLRPD